MFVCIHTLYFLCVSLKRSLWRGLSLGFLVSFPTGQAKQNFRWLMCWGRFGEMADLFILNRKKHNYHYIPQRKFTYAIELITTKQEKLSIGRLHLFLGSDHQLQYRNIRASNICLWVLLWTFIFIPTHKEATPAGFWPALLECFTSQWWGNHLYYEASCMAEQKQPCFPVFLCRIALVLWVSCSMNLEKFYVMCIPTTEWSLLGKHAVVTFRMSCPAWTFLLFPLAA